MKCKQCDKELSSNNPRAKFCSHKCKLQYHRLPSQPSVSKVSVSKVSVSTEPDKSGDSTAMSSTAEWYTIDDIDTRDCKELINDYTPENKIKFLTKYGNKNYVIAFGKESILHIFVPEVDPDDLFIPNWMLKREPLKTS